MRPIIVVGPNPAVDYTLEVPGFRPGEVNRTGKTFRVAGGKPVNVARTIRRLGGEVLLVTPLGGPGGALVAGSAHELGIQLWPVPIAGDTRTAVIIVDAEKGAPSVINETGPELDAREAESFEALSLAALPRASLVVASGSLPPGLPIDYYSRIAAAAREVAVPFILDASGDALRAGIRGRPTALKINAEEALQVSGVDDPREAVSALRAGGIEHVIVTLGDQGAVYGGPAGIYQIGAVPVTAINPIASGDAFLGALAVALNGGRTWDEALRLASAVAGHTAGLMVPDPGAEPPIQSLLERVTVTAIGPDRSRCELLRASNLLDLDQSMG